MTQPAVEDIWPDRASIERIQLQRLRSLLAAVESQNPFWSDRLQQAQIASADVRSLDDLRRLPVL